MKPARALRVLIVAGAALSSSLFLTGVFSAILLSATTVVFAVADRGLDRGLGDVDVAGEPWSGDALPGPGGDEVEVNVGRVSFRRTALG